MSKYLKWLDTHILEYFSLFLLIFIPLFPKVPVADILPGYLVRIRLDDLFVALAFAIWVIWLLRRKVTLKNNPLVIPIAIYFVVGFLSTLSAMFITKTVPVQSLHVEKMYLHFLRRFEYASVFFVFFSSIKSLSQIKKYVFLAAIVLLGVSLYGFGQKYLYWPAYSTMNREFSKGIKLYLTEHARVLSTFGGHYDLAAYVMILLTLLIPTALVIKNIFIKLGMLVASIAAFWLLILTVSRTSFLAYMVALTVAFLFLIQVKGFLWSASRWFVVVTLSLVVMLSFGDLSDRFAHVLKLDKLKTNFALLKPIKKQAPSGAEVGYLNIVADKTDVPPTTNRPDKTKPSDVYDNTPDFVTTSGIPASMAAHPRIYSQNSVQYDLSTGIRLDYTWPQAIKGFTRNPILGSGYSTLTKQTTEEFTEAESTDNDFLRSLGETGLLGFLSFFGMIVYVIYYAVSKIKNIKDPLFATLTVTIVAGIIGLLVNAIYIDVFEASKVAYTFWIMVAILIATVQLASQKKVAAK